jgi:hypothetical protein
LELNYVHHIVFLQHNFLPVFFLQAAKHQNLRHVSNPAAHVRTRAPLYLLDFTALSLISQADSTSWQIARAANKPENQD